VARRKSISLLMRAPVLPAAVARAQAKRDRLTVEQFLDWELVASSQVSPPFFCRERWEGFN